MAHATEQRPANDPSDEADEKFTEKFVLIVEDDPGFRKLLRKTLERSGYAVREAENGLVAKTIFDLTKDGLLLVISDIKMPAMDGVELLKHIRQTSQVPYVVMTGFSEVLESGDAFKLGANEFIAKPFRTDDLLHIINTCLNPTPREPGETGKKPSAPTRFCAVHIDDFISSTRVISDIYVKLTEEKYIKVAHRGDTIPIERLRTYKEKRVEYLYVTLEDLGQYVGFNFKVATVAAKNSNLPAEKKLRLLKQTSEILVHHCFLTGVDAEMVNPARQMIENTLELVTQDPDVLDLFLSLETNGDRTYAHSVCVSVYACLVARQHGWVSSPTLFKVSMSGLLHDIGKKEIDREILEKKRFALTKDEIKLIESHPVRGKEIISQIRSLPEDVGVIVLQHHENHAGTGYPNRLAGVDVHPLAKLIGTVDKVVGHMLPMRPEEPKLGPEAAILRVLTLSKEEVDLTFLRRLMEVFQLDADAMMSKAA